MKPKTWLHGADQGAHMIYDAQDELVWRKTKCECPRCGKEMDYYYCEEALYLIRCMECRTITLKKACNPFEAAEVVARKR